MSGNLHAGINDGAGLPKAWNMEVMFHASEIVVKPVLIETSLEALAPTCGERLAHDERPAVVGEDYGGALMVFGNDSPRPLGDECHSRFTTPDYDKPATLFSWSVSATHHMPLTTKRPATMPAALGASSTTVRPFQCALGRTTMIGGIHEEARQARPARLRRYRRRP